MSRISDPLPPGAYVQRIDSVKCSTYGWQARAHAPGSPLLTKFFSDGQHGGYWAAMFLAEKEALRLRRRAGRLQAGSDGGQVKKLKAKSKSAKEQPKRGLK